jgi:hypothetical protein
MRAGRDISLDRGSSLGCLSGIAIGASGGLIGVGGGEFRIPIPLPESASG